MHLDANQLFNRCMYDESRLPNILYELVTWKNRGFRGLPDLRCRRMKSLRDLEAAHRGEATHAHRYHLADQQRKEEKEK